MSGRRNKRGGGGGGDGGEERWLLPCSDMITLLLGLFIVLFAMSSIDAKKFDHVRRSLSQTFKGSVLQDSGGVMPGSSGALDPSAANQDPQSAITLREQASNTTRAAYEKEQKRLDRLARQAGLKQDVQVEPSERGIRVSIAGDALFASGRYDLTDEAQAKLRGIGRELAAFGRPIEIVGHTDRVPFNGEFGNLGLSMHRAASVEQFFASLGVDPADMRSSGMGDKEPRVETKALDVRANRRIEIIVLAPGVDDAGLPGGTAGAQALPKVVPDIAAEVQAATRVTPSKPPAANSSIVDPIVRVAGG